MASHVIYKSGSRLEIVETKPFNEYVSPLNMLVEIFGPHIRLVQTGKMRNTNIFHFEIKIKAKKIKGYIVPV